MKVTSKEMYKILREELAPILKAAGFKRTSGGMLGWYKPVEGRYLSLWFQCDKYGWFQDFGSRVTLELQVADDPRPGYGRLLERERFVTFLSEAELELVRAANNEVIASPPESSTNNPILLLTEEGRKWFMAGYLPHVDPYAMNQDVWLHYFTPAQVKTWAEFFSDRILHIGEAFLAGIKHET